jgi:hypothetical protein
MKARELILFISLFLIFKQAKSQSWIWSRQIGGSNTESARSICLDSSGNIYVTGQYWSSPCYFNSETLNPYGANDFFIAKYDSNGNEIWVKSFGGNNTAMEFEGIWKLIYDANSNSIVFSASYYGTCILGNDTLAGYPGSFFARIDTACNFLWVYPTNSAFINLDRDGNIFAEYMSSTVFTIDTFSAGSGVWLAKFNSTGNFLWAKKVCNANTTSYGYDAYFITFEIKDDKIFGIGVSSVDTFLFDTVQVYANYSTGQYIIGCLDTSANALWVNACAGQNYLGGYDITVDNNKSSYITGSFGSDAIFEQDTLRTTALSDLFIAKYDSSGNFIWAHQANCRSIGTALTLDANENIYLSGSFRDTAIIDADTIISTVGDLLLAKYTSSGHLIGLRHCGQAGASDVSVESNGFVYLTGNFYDTITFDNNPSLASYGQGDIYISKSNLITGGIGSERTVNNNHLIIYANPNEGKCNITVPDDFLHEKNLTLSILDNNGKLIQQKTLQMNEGKIKVNIEQEAKGIYNVTLSNGRKSYSGKIVFE